MKVRISKTPALDELDGVRLDDMEPGTVREVSPSIGAWLVVERCAEPEMRQNVRPHEEDFLSDQNADTGNRLSGPHRRADER